MRDGLDDDDVAECQPVYLPGVTSGGPGPQAVWGCSPALTTVDCRARRHDQRRDCRSLAQGYRPGAAEALGSDDERPLVGGHAEPQRLQPEPGRRACGVDEHRDAVPQIACTRDHHADRPSSQGGASEESRIDRSAPRCRAGLSWPQTGEAERAVQDSGDQP